MPLINAGATKDEPVLKGISRQSQENLQVLIIIIIIIIKSVSLAETTQIKYIFHTQIE
jgi:hypothetical protein